MSDMDLFPDVTDFLAPPGGLTETEDLADITPNYPSVEDRPAVGPSSIELDRAEDFQNQPQDEVGQDFERPVSRYIQAVIDYPTDKLVLRTFVVPANKPEGPTLILNRQVQGWAARVRVRNVGAQPCYLLTDNEQATPSATAAQVYPTGFLLAAGAELALTTRNAIWAIAAGVAGTNDATVSVASESYVC